MCSKGADWIVTIRKDVKNVYFTVRLAVDVKPLEMFADNTSFYLGILKVQVDNASLTFWSQRSLILLKCLRRHTQKDLAGVSRSLTRCLPTIPVLLPAQLSQERLRRKSVSAVIWKNRPLALDRRRGCWPGEENGARRTQRICIRYSERKGKDSEWPAEEKGRED